MTGLLNVVPLISSVASKVGVMSMSIIDLEIVGREFRTTEWIEPAVGECERSMEFKLGLGEEYVSIYISISEFKSAY